MSNAALHADALVTLRTWEPPNDRQRTLRDRYVTHLERNPDGVGRECYPDHLTASTLLLSADGSHLLLTLHAKAKQWFQFGGHCEAGDVTLAGAALREAREESGLHELALDPIPFRLDEHAVPFCGTRGGVHHLDVWFLAIAPENAEASVSEESLDVRWWSLDGLPGDPAAWTETLGLIRQR